MASFNTDRAQQPSGQSTTTKEKQSLGTVEVSIQGEQFSVRSDRDPEVVEQLADHVDDVLGQLQNAAPASASREKLLMMASLTIAEELFEARNEANNLQQEVRQRTEAMEQLLDKLEQQV